MSDEGVFAGIDALSPEMQAAIDLVAQQTGVVVRQRCCMPELARSSECGWRHRPVTASIRGTLPGLTADQLKETYIAALNGWNSVCNTGLVWTDDFARANIWAECKKIDGASGTLAWSYLVPCGGSTNGTRLEQRYDTSERWTVDWFHEVSLHELGHALGLDHDTKNRNALMYPYSSGGKILKPTQFEIARVVPLYGPPVTSPTPGVPKIAGGVLLIDDGTSVGLSGNGFDYAGNSYRLGVTPV